MENHQAGNRKASPSRSAPQEQISPDQVELIAKGDSLLKRLCLEAAAARAEARKAELEGLLSDARRGNVQALESWLVEQGELPARPEENNTSDGNSSDGHDSRNAVATARADQPHGFKPTVERSLEGAVAFDSWDRLIPFAQARIEARHSDLRGPSGEKHFPPSGNDSRELDVEPKSNVQGKAVETEVGHPAVRRAADKTSPSISPQAVVKKPKLQLQSTSRGQKQRLAVIADRLDSQQPEEQQENHRRVVFFSRLSGVATSILAHLLLLAILAFVTLKLPPSPAGMAFESASTEMAEEAFELTQPLDAEITDEVLDPVAAEESTLEAVDELSELTSTLSDSSTETTLAPQSISSALAAASSAMAAPASAMNASASFFGAAAGGNCFCYVIDGSGSMRGGPWDAAKLELLKSLASLKSNQRFYIIFFNRELAAIPLPGEREPAPRALYATAENLQHARRWIESLTIDLGAPPNKALALAIEKEPDAIYLLTDGVTKVDVAAFLREENRVSDLISGEQVLVPIHTIAFYTLDGQQLLQQIAMENRGQFIYVPDPRNRN